MKKLTGIIVILIATIMMFTSAAYANARIDFDDTVRVKKETALKKARTNNSKTITIINEDEMVQRIAVNGKWTKVAFGNKKGWVKTNTLKDVDIKLMYTTGKAKMKATWKSKAKYTIPKNKVVRVYYTKGDYSYVIYNNHGGWIKTKKLHERERVRISEFMCGLDIYAD